MKFCNIYWSTVQYCYIELAEIETITYLNSALPLFVGIFNDCERLFIDFFIFIYKFVGQTQLAFSKYFKSVGVVVPIMRHTPTQWRALWLERMVMLRHVMSVGKRTVIEMVLRNLTVRYGHFIVNIAYILLHILKKICFTENE